MNLYFVLDPDKNPKPVDDIHQLTTWASSINTTVARTEIYGLTISTIFLGINHQWKKELPPILFETMVFGDSCYDQFQQRYATWEEAEVGHQQVVAGIVAEVRGESDHHT